jgi:hypothetical protein
VTCSIPLHWALCYYTSHRHPHPAPLRPQQGTGRPASHPTQHALRACGRWRVFPLPYRETPYADWSALDSLELAGVRDGFDRLGGPQHLLATDPHGVGPHVRAEIDVLQRRDIDPGRAQGFLVADDALLTRGARSAQRSVEASPTTAEVASAPRTFVGDGVVAHKALCDLTPARVFVGHLTPFLVKRWRLELVIQGEEVLSPVC